MPDVMIIGGGLSGLAAAYELEKQAVDYTLVEVKPQLGGSIGTLRQAGYVIDSGAFVLADTLDRDWLDSLGLSDALFDVGGNVAFKQGTGTLIDALSARLSAPRLMRMAVSSIGELENGRYSICMENGLLLKAKAIIVALPARYAERLFYGYISEITEQLLGYHYDTIVRVSLGYRSQDLPKQLAVPPDMAYVFTHRTQAATRVPQGGELVQIGLRIDPARLDKPEDAIELLRDTFELPAPQTYHIGYWAEADPVSCYDDKHSTWVQATREKLPDGIALIGNDYSLSPPMQYGVTFLDTRINQGQAAAQQVLQVL